MDISLSDVTVTLPERPAPKKNNKNRVLFRIRSLVIPLGSRIFIEGASGVGKSTLLHLMAGLFLPESGVVKVGPHLFQEMNDEARSRIRRQNFSMIFQKLNLVEHLTALENVQLGLKAQSNEAAHKALTRVGLKDRANDRIGLMSLGEQQRVAVARALAAQPIIVFADEPTSSLDARNAEIVVDRLLDVPKTSTVVVVSHDQRIRSRFHTVLQFGDLTA